MDFGIYPPEVNSGRMYAGPGSGPMLAAAQAWNGLADELYTAAGAYQSVVSELTSGSWAGPSSASMAAAAGSYVTWLSGTAAQAEETAAQSAAAAAAYESAFASTVPPPVIAANRSLLMSLVATNFFGQNTPAIAAAEVAYAEMWAQDAVAMYGYAASSASATALTPFSAPQQSTDPGATIGQAAAVSQAASSSAGDAQSIVASVPQTLSAVPGTLQSLATASPTATSSSLLTILNVLNQLITVTISVPGQATNFLAVPLGILAGPVDIPFSVTSYLVSNHEDGIASGWDGVVPWPDVGPAPPTAFPAIITGAGQTAASASLAQANTVGKLSVPPGWTVAAPEIRSVAVVSPLTGAGPAAAAPLEAGSANMFNQMGLGGMAGQAMTGNSAPCAQDSGKTSTRARVTNFVVGESKSTADDDDVEVLPAPRTVVTGVAAAIRDIARQRAQGLLSEREYHEQKKRLLAISAGERPSG